MLLVAITGPVGSEKTTALHEFATGAKERGYSVDGFVSVAGNRAIADKGADSYTLNWIKTGDQTLFAHRGKEAGYIIDPTTTERLRTWSENLAIQDIIVLDEFGNWEAEGNGLIEIWEGIEKSLPRMVVVTLREGVQEAVEVHLHRTFDRVLPADVSTPDRLLVMLEQLRDWERIGVFGAGSGGVEWSLGSWLHATKFPFVGTVMGSIQASVLALASERIGRKSLTMWVSFIAAGMKALSPAGSRINPTIAITAQGFLFTLGAMAFRWSRAGIAFGAFLVGVWAALQGFFIQYLILGKSLEKAWDAGIHWLAAKGHFSAPTFWGVALLLAAANGCISAALTLAVTRPQSRYRAKLESMMESPLPKPPSKQGSVYRDLARPVFWLPLVLVSAILLFAKETPMNVLWMILRAIAVVLVVSGIVRAANLDRVFDLLRRREQWGPAHAMRTAKDRNEPND